MSIQIKLKNSVVQDSTPSASDLPEVGELAVNGNINSIGGFMRASDNTIVKIFGPGSVTTPTATTTVSGISELATNSETTTGTATNRVVTPAGLNAVTVAERTTSNTNYVAKAGSTLTGVLTMPNGSNSAPAINFGDSDSGIFGGTNTVSLAAGGTTRLTADTGVSVVGTLAVTGAITSTSDLTIADKIIHSGDTNTAIRFPAADTVSVETDGSEALRVDSSQRLLVGTSTARSPQGITPSLQIEGTNVHSSSISITRNSADNGSPVLIFNKSRGATVGSDVAVQNNDVLGIVSFAANDGTDSDSLAGRIVAEVDGTPGSNDIPGRLVFQTTADGAASPTERMRINSSGFVGINQNTPTCQLQVDAGSSGSGTSTALELNHKGNDLNDAIKLNFARAGGDIGSIVLEKVNNNNTTDFIFNTRASNTVSESMRITGAGNVGIGTTSPQSILSAKVSASRQLDVIKDSGDDHLVLKSTAPDASYNMRSIELAGSDVSFSTGASSGTSYTERMRINSSGNVGIGTTGVTNAKLAVNGRCHVDTTLTFGANSTLDGAVQATIYKPATNMLAFATAGNNERMRIDSSGNVGIGATTIANDSGHAKLAISGTSGNNAGILVFQDSSNNEDGAIFSDNASLFIVADRDNTTASSNIVFRVDGSSEKMRINSSGNVGIGTSSPTGFIHIEGSSNGTETYGRFSTGSANGDQNLYIQSSSSRDHMALQVKTGAGANDDLSLNPSGGNVGIGTTSPARLLHQHVSSSAANYHSFTNDTTGSGSGNGLLLGINQDEESFVWNYENTNLRFGTNNSERMRIDSSGNVGIGTSSPDTLLDVSSSDDAVVRIQSEGSDATDDARLEIKTTNGTFTIQNDRSLGTSGALTFAGNSSNNLVIDHDGGNVGIGTSSPAKLLDVKLESNGIVEQYLRNTVINLLSKINGTTSAQFGTETSHPLAFLVANNERMRIDTSGRLLIGATSIGVASTFYDDLVISNTASGTGAGITLIANATNGFNAIDFCDTAAAGRGRITYGHDVDRMMIDVGGAEAMRITNSGKILIARTNEDGSGVINLALNSSGHGISTRTGSNSTQTHLDFGNQHGIVGSIQTNGTSTSFNTSSDYRLKENAVAISDGITRLKTLKPYRFNFKTDSSTILDGFFAHEVSSAVPEAISGAKDAVDEDNNPIHQGIDQSKLVPLLVAAVQELIGRVETLEAA